MSNLSHMNLCAVSNGDIAVFFVCDRWKNNVERKSKSLALLKDAAYKGMDDKLRAR